MEYVCNCCKEDLLHYERIKYICNKCQYAGCSIEYNEEGLSKCKAHNRTTYGQGYYNNYHANASANINPERVKYFNSIKARNDNDSEFYKEAHKDEPSERNDKGVALCDNYPKCEQYARLPKSNPFKCKRCYGIYKRKCPGPTSTVHVHKMCSCTSVDKFERANMLY